MENGDRSLAIESILPTDFIYDLGCYLQSCAQIELQASALITVLEGLRPGQASWKEEFYKARKLPTGDLKKRLRSAARSAKEFGFEEELLGLCDWLDRFVGNRHLAVHGAFFGNPNGFLRVEYARKEGNEFFPTRQAITKSLVKEAVEDADRILLVLIRMLEAVETGLSISTAIEAIPIVEHPKEN